MWLYRPDGTPGYTATGYQSSGNTRNCPPSEKRPRTISQKRTGNSRQHSSICLPALWQPNCYCSWTLPKQSCLWLLRQDGTKVFQIKANNLYFHFDAVEIQIRSQTNKFKLMQPVCIIENRDILMYEGTHQSESMMAITMMTMHSREIR